MTEEANNTSVSDDYKVGDRIEYLSHYGTIKYIGEVEGYSSIWLGIDWDDPSRGKHNGSVNEKCYFNSSSPTSGSFIRPAKLKPGIDSITAITSRYGKKSSSNEVIIKQELSNLQREINAPFISMVGFDKVNEIQSNFQDLRVVSLRMQRVNNPGPDGKLLEICPNITELDLSKNLFNSWNDIFTICNQLKNLRWLCVSENLLELNIDPKEYQFPTLRTIICGFMKLNWDDILKITQIFPELKELRSPFNLISNINIPTDHHLNNINLIDLEGNEISDWNEINKLGFLPYLEQLNVRRTSVQNIDLGPCEENGKISIFKSLKQLIISENRIENWESISELNKLQCLEDLRFLKNPILETETPATCFQLIVARISNLTILNGTIIKSTDRKGAEYDYIKKQGLEWLKVKNDETQKKEFLVKHPRYLELITKYGEPEESELSSQAPSLKTSLTNVEICYNDKKISKKLPSTMMLQKLVMLVQKLFNLPERPELYYVNTEHPDMEIQMDDEFKEIGFYSLQNGDKIYVKL